MMLGIRCETKTLSLDTAIIYHSAMFSSQMNTESFLRPFLRASEGHSVKARDWNLSGTISTSPTFPALPLNLCFITV